MSPHFTNAYHFPTAWADLFHAISVPFTIIPQSDNTTYYLKVSTNRAMATERASLRLRLSTRSALRANIIRSSPVIRLGVSVAVLITAFLT